MAYSEDGAMRAGMGTDSADVDGDGKFDLIITNFQHEPNALYRNTGPKSFEEISYPSGIGSPSLNHLAFGVIFADLDGDGLQDIYVGNGHVVDNVRQFDDTSSYEQVDQVFRSRGGGRFEEVLPSTGAFPATASVTRSVAAGDFNNDGMADLLINSLDRPARLLQNRSPHGHWIGLKLQGSRSNRDAIGARVELRDKKTLQVREVRSGGSYLAQSDLRVLFNLRKEALPGDVKLRIRWPSGRFDEIATPALDRYTTIVEGQP